MRPLHGVQRGVDVRRLAVGRRVREAAARTGVVVERAERLSLGDVLTPLSAHLEGKWRMY
jgi:hypothetical protein